jgi:hypothetical protein
VREEYLIVVGFYDFYLIFFHMRGLAVNSSFILTFVLGRHGLVLPPSIFLDFLQNKMQLIHFFSKPEKEILLFASLYGHR